MYCTVGTAAGANAVVPRGAVMPYPTAGAGAAAVWAAFTEEELMK
jgi:hypothetical protein